MHRSVHDGLAEYLAAQSDQVDVIADMLYYPEWRVRGGYERAIGMTRHARPSPSVAGGNTSPPANPFSKGPDTRHFFLRNRSWIAGQVVAVTADGCEGLTQDVLVAAPPDHRYWGWQAVGEGCNSGATISRFVIPHLV